jgi:hypothetical protein
METSKYLTVQSGKKDHETGLTIKDSFLSKAGFSHQVGVRDFGELKIIEGVSKGTATMFLNSILVLDQNGKLIFDAEVNKYTNYSREKVRQLVLNGLANMLREAAESEGEYFDEIEIYEKIDAKLKLAFYEQSYSSVLNWAKRTGII